MRVFVTVGDGVEKEWVLVEMQGAVEARAGGSVKGLPFGELEMKGKTAHLVVGQHLLTGKVVALQKPFIVMHKCVGEQKQALLSQTEEQSASTTTQTKYTVCGIIHKKILFSQRPKPIVNM
eukprot:m.105222 g.105222  ORF g.105222 m.105222 type:complete len:121 (-) comp13272_c0_seq1:317-679(-)